MKLLIIDCHAVGHYMKHGLYSLDYQGIKTGIVYGFLKKLLSLGKITQPDTVIFAWDSRDSNRKKIYPEYKFKRYKEKTSKEKYVDSETFKQFEKLRSDILPYIGFSNNFIVDGLEADDIIASIVMNNIDTEQITIASSDNDLYQLLYSNVRMYRLHQADFYNQCSFYKEFDIEFDLWASVKSISGCSGDGVPGVDGVGDTTAIKYLKGKLKSTTKSFKDIQSYLGSDKYEINSRLVTLPFVGTPHFKIIKDEHLSLGNFLNICHRNDFRSFTKVGVPEQWCSYFNFR
jgi:DNA polymerase I